MEKMIKCKRDRVNAWQKTYYAQNIKKYGKRITSRLAAYKNNAKRKGRTWDIPKDLFADLVTDNCFYCGATPETLHGMDRVHNEGGYTENNVVTCCTNCNAAKRVFSVGEFAIWLDRLYGHSNTWRNVQ